MEKYEDKIYSLGEAVTGQTQAMSQAVQKTLENNGGVGIMTGSYDQNLSITPGRQPRGTAGKPDPHHQGTGLDRKSVV